MTKTQTLQAPVFCIAVLSCLIASPLLGASLIYVHANATGANDGTSWADAYSDLQDALTEAESGNEPCEIWVAGGVYRPDRGTGDRWASFRMLDQVALYGGFAGNEECREERDWSAHETVLTGDLLGNDDPDYVSPSTCCYESFGAGCDDQACQDILSAIEFIPVPRCDLYWHSVCSVLAQSVCCDLCRPTTCDNSSTVIRANVVHEGVVVDGFTIRSGEAACETFGECVSSASGFDVQFSDIIVRNCRFTQNTGTPALRAYQSQIKLENSKFFDNDEERWPSSHAFISSGAAGSFSEVVDCTFEGNEGAVHFRVTGAVRRCQFLGGGAALRVGASAAPALVEDCVFKNHHSFSIVGASDTFVTFENCLFVGNNAEHQVLGNSTAAVTLYNCVFSGNTRQAISNDVAMSIRNCSIYGNSGNGGAPAGISNSGNLTVRNSVIWGNTAANANSTFDAQIRNSIGGGTFTLYYNSIEGLPPESDANGNVGLDPMFVDAFGPDNMKGTLDDNLRLSLESPLINLGQPEPTLSSHQDADGHARILCGSIDMGAYEFGIGDYDCDRIVELADFASFPACLTGPAPEQPYSSDCAAYDFATELAEDVDLRDFAGLQNSFDIP